MILTSVPFPGRSSRGLSSLTGSAPDLTTQNTLQKGPCTHVVMGGGEWLPCVSLPSAVRFIAIQHSWQHKQHQCLSSGDRRGSQVATGVAWTLTSTLTYLNPASFIPVLTKASAVSLTCNHQAVSQKTSVQSQAVLGAGLEILVHVLSRPARSRRSRSGSRSSIRAAGG